MKKALLTLLVLLLPASAQAGLVHGQVFYVAGGPLD